MIGKCLHQNENCPLRPDKRRSVGHHEYYPASNYPLPIEKEWRDSKIIQRCVCIEIQDPHRNPLPKPSLSQMIMDLTAGLDTVD